MTKDITLITTEAYKISKNRQFQGHSQNPYNIMASDWNKEILSCGHRKTLKNNADLKKQGEGEGLCLSKQPNKK